MTTHTTRASAARGRRSRRSLGAALLLALVPTLTGAPVFAEVPTPPDASTKAARARFQEGVEFYDRGQYEAARAAFLQAYALRKHPAVLLNLAQSCLRSGHPLESIKYFEQFTHDSTTVTAAQSNDVERGLAEARAKLGQLEVSAPVGAEIFLDGTPIGTAPLPEFLDVEPGVHTVRVRLPDGTNDTKNASLAAGDRSKIVFSAQEKPTVVAPVPVPTTAEGTPAPASPLAPPAASTTESAQEPTSPGNEGPSNLASSSSQRWSTTPGYIGLAVGGAGLVTAAVFGLFKSNAQDAANSVANDIHKSGGTAGTCVSTNPATIARFGNACQTLRDNNNKVDTDATIGNIALGVGIAGAVAGGVWLLVSTLHNSHANEPRAGWQSVRPVPLLSAENRGLGFEGRF